ncbi:MAG: HAD hydrolase-like protein [Sandaracinaceae bacterium]|nr:HAD hydrolase-like protein [Sandaracinaceae bacterium]
MLHAVLFDLDDTLYSERDFVSSGFDAVAAHAASELGVRGATFRAALDDALRDHGRGHTFDRALEAQGLSHEEIASIVPELVHVYRQHRPRIALLPDATRCLDALVRADVPCGVVTDGHPEVQRAKVEALGLRGRLEIERYTWDAGEAFQKPHRLAFEPALAVLAARGIFAHEVAYVGDNPTKDFVGARALGLTTFRIHRGPHANIEMPRVFEAEHRIHSLDELLPAVLRPRSNADHVARWLFPRRASARAMRAAP